MKKSILALFSSALAAVLLLSACGAKPASSTVAPSAGTSSTPASSAPITGENTKLIIGASPAPHAEILEQLVPVLAAQGITLEIKVFNDYIIPNNAVEDGSLDANFFQHQPYLDDFNAKNGTHLITAANTHIEPLGIYPGRKTSLDELKDGVTIGIPNDPTNEGRALHLLATQGYITLKEGAGLEVTPKDIVENPHNINFVELEAAQLPVTLQDLDFAVINGNYAIGAGIGDTSLVTESADSPYVNIIVVLEGSETRPEIQALVQAFQTEEIRTFINETYGGVVVPVF